MAATTPARSLSRRGSWRAWMAARWAAILVAAVSFPVALAATYGTFYWPGRPFPGFFVQGNRLVPAIGLYQWTGWQAGVPLLWQITAVDGVPVGTSADIYDAVARRPIGSAVRYDFANRTATLTRDVPTMRFSGNDYWSTVGVFIVCGWAAVSLGVAVGLLQPATPAAHAFLAQASATGLYGLTGAALYHPHQGWLTP